VEREGDKGEEWATGISRICGRRRRRRRRRNQKLRVGNGGVAAEKLVLSS
jgi:hypothetical protein